MSYSDVIHWVLLATVWIIPALIASMRKHPWASTIWLVCLIPGCVLHFGIVWIPLSVWACWPLPRAKQPVAL